MFHPIIPLRDKSGGSNSNKMSPLPSTKTDKEEVICRINLAKSDLFARLICQIVTYYPHNERDMIYVISLEQKKIRDVQQECEVAIFKQVFYQVK